MDREVAAPRGRVARCPTVANIVLGSCHCERFTAPGGELIHGELRFGDAVVMLTQDGADPDAPARSPERLGGYVSAIMATYWDDVDAAWERAVAAGAEVIYPLADQFYGERAGRLRDPFGQQWMLSARL